MTIIISRATGIPVPNPQPMALVYLGGDRVNGNGQTTLVSLQGLPNNSQFLSGEYVEVFNRSGRAIWDQNNVATYPIGADGKLNETFAEASAYFAIDASTRYLMNLGINIPEIVKQHHDGTFHPAYVTVNGVTDLNAWVERRNHRHTYGTGNGKMILGANQEVVSHERGHEELMHIAPNLGGVEGNAFHEAFGDLRTAFITQDPEVSEEFNLVINGVADVNLGLRSAKNDLTLSKAGMESHDRSLAYSGLLWSTMLFLEDQNKQLSGSALAEAMIRMQYATGFNLQTMRPKPADIVTAFLDGATRLVQRGEVPFAFEQIRDGFLAEAIKREIVTPTESAILVQSTNFNQPIRQNMVHYLGGGIQAGPTVYEQTSRCNHLGICYETHQQYINTANYGRVPVLESQLLVRRDHSGAVVHVSNTDVQNITPSNIYASQASNYKDALNSQLSKLQAARDLANNSLITIRNALPLNLTDLEKAARLSKAQMALRIAENNLETLNSELSRADANKSPEYAFLMDDTGNARLHYVLRCQFASLYVDATTPNPSYTSRSEVIVN